MIKAEFEKAQRPKRSKLAIAAGALVAVVLVVGGIVVVNAASEYRAEIDAKLAAAQQYYDDAAEQNELSVQAASSAEQSAQRAQDAADATEAAEAAAKAKAAAAKAKAAAEATGSVYGQYPSGYAVPFIASSDPENANGGDYDVNACASKSATTVNGVPRCD
jgi:hypothetical protein